MALSTSSFAATTYDYVIAGGGTAGLALAVRLTENASVSVAVVEAGEDRSGDLLVEAWGLTGEELGNSSYDWAFKTAPQTSDEDRIIAWPRGRQLGGSSGLNFWAWQRPSQDDMNNWEALGNHGWSWNELMPYFLKTEAYCPPSDQEDADLQIGYIDRNAHGTRGPIKISYPPEYDEFSRLWNPTFENLGLGGKGEPYGGKATGSFTGLLSQDPKNASRSYAITAYYQPNAGRPNLKVLTNAMVNNIVFATRKSADSRLIATGVNFTTEGKSYVVKAKHEIILSAGVTQSPQLLELSGIGGSTLLEPLGIKVLIDNSNVGENLQDHQYTSLSFKVRDDVQTLDFLNDPVIKQQAIDHSLESLKLSANSSLAQSALREKMAGLVRTSTGGIAEQYEIITRKLLDPVEPFAQELFTPRGLVSPPSPGRFLTLYGLLAHPYSRGSIHINSSKPTEPPVIDPCFLCSPIDVELLAIIALHLQKLATTQPLASLLEGNGTVFAPTYRKLIESNVQQHVREKLGEFQHPIGTCSMQPRDKGGVVDPRLKVYGTQNVRVVDASVIPIQPVGTIQSLVYAVAEKAADIIKEDQRGY